MLLLNNVIDLGTMIKIDINMYIQTAEDVKKEISTNNVAHQSTKKI